MQQSMQAVPCYKGISFELSGPIFADNISEKEGKNVDH